MASSLTSLLSSLQTSLDSAILPPELDVLPPQHGISLLDVKNELFLSYLQNLVFLILIKLRHRSSIPTSEEADDEVDDEEEGMAQLDEEATKKLAELRLYLEKGVKPLEARLKYQIDKVVKAAEDATRDTVVNGALENTKKSKRKDKSGADDDFSNASGSSDEEEDEDSVSSEEIDELSYRPNPSALLRPSTNTTPQGKSEPSDGIYRPPRITATSMPTTKGKDERAERKPTKSRTLEEYISTELSTVPMAEPSIGSTIVAGGRHTKTQRERDDDANRKRFEEDHLMRLPKESKKDKAKRGGMDRNGGYGGEEWRDLGAGLDRIERLVKKTGGKLDQSRKRKIDVGDGPRDSGAAAGTEFAKKKKTVMRRFK
jgi:U3 small nucleolar ribonucleoprotein protein LCP5